MAELRLTKGYVAIIDDEDFDRLSQWKWTAVVTGQRIKRVYAYRRALVPGDTPRRQALYLHRAILNAPDGSDVDHINGDTLDNSRANLRLATRSQNLANSRRARGVTGFRGVTIDKRDGAFVMRCSGASKRFATAEGAARAYDAAARQRYGQFAKLNFQDEIRDEVA
jgi:hypothetical protein